MKGDPKIVAALNERLSEELTAVSQYMVHAEMCANWGYGKLADKVEHRAIDEMKHAEKLIGRILFLSGITIVSNLQKMYIGDKVEVQLRNDLESELGANLTYNASIKLAVEIGDNGSRELFETILKDEEEHIDWLEAQLDQIDQMGLANYLETQI